MATLAQQGLYKAISICKPGKIFVLFKELLLIMLAESYKSLHVRIKSMYVINFQVMELENCCTCRHWFYIDIILN